MIISFRVSCACNSANSMSTVTKICVCHEKWECQLHRCFVSSFYDLYSIPWNQIALCALRQIAFRQKKNETERIHAS